MKKLICFLVILAISPLVSAQRLDITTNDSWLKTKFNKDSFTGDFFNLDALLKKHEEKTFKKIFLSKTDDKHAIAYTGEAQYPFAEPGDLEFIKTIGLVTEKYLIPLGYSLYNNYQMEMEGKTGAYYDGSFIANSLVIGLKKEESVALGTDVFVELTPASKYSIQLHDPVFKKHESGFGYYYETTPITDAQRKKASSSTGKYMIPDGNTSPGNDINLERELSISYFPKYFKLEVVFDKKEGFYNCATSEQAAQGIKCEVAPVEVLRNGKEVIGFYLVPDLEALAKDLQFVKKSLEASLK